MSESNLSLFDRDVGPSLGKYSEDKVATDFFRLYGLALYDAREEVENFTPRFYGENEIDPDSNE